ncbi:MAG: hypothetical protein IJ368_04785 [Oscillospiraceae bacterium]|nr:hypothetical protein [Oscillospiraceae bacterium]
MNKIKKSENFKKILDRGCTVEVYYNIDGVFPDGVKITSVIRISQRGGEEK